MGQQQLLLLVFGILIVAVAIIAGMQAFEEGFRKMLVDRMVDRNLAIATHAAVWKTTRDPYNGGNARYTGLMPDGMRRLSLEPDVAGVTYAITSASDVGLEITAVSQEHPDLGVRTYVRGYDVDSTVVRYDGSITLD
jgi:hypothetical protein